MIGGTRGDTRSLDKSSYDSLTYGVSVIRGGGNRVSGSLHPLAVHHGFI